MTNKTHALIYVNKDSSLISHLKLILNQYYMICTHTSFNNSTRFFPVPGNVLKFVT